MDHDLMERRTASKTSRGARNGAAGIPVEAVLYVVLVARLRATPAPRRTEDRRDAHRSLLARSGGALPAFRPARSR